MGYYFFYSYSLFCYSTTTVTSPSSPTSLTTATFSTPTTSSTSISTSISTVLSSGFGSPAFIHCVLYLSSSTHEFQYPPSFRNCTVDILDSCFGLRFATCP